MSVGCKQPQKRGHLCSADATYCYLRPSSSPDAPQVRSVSRQAQSSFGAMDEASRSGAAHTAMPARTCGTRPTSAPTRTTAIARGSGASSTGCVELGIDNVRILGSSELSPLKNSITPAFRDAVGTTIARRCCAGSTTRWPRWANAGMTRRHLSDQFLGMVGRAWGPICYWINGGKYIDMNDPGPSVAGVPRLRRRASTADRAGRRMYPPLCARDRHAAPTASPVGAISTIRRS